MDMKTHQEGGCPQAEPASSTLIFYFPACGTVTKLVFICKTTWPASWEICMQVKKQQLEPDKEQRTGSKLRKGYVKAVYCHPAYLTYMQSTSCEMLGWM